MSATVSLASYGIQVQPSFHNLSPAMLYEHAVLNDGGKITSSGAIATDSGAKTGRSPGDKRIVREPSTEDDVWWGEVNIPLESESFAQIKQTAIDFFNTCEQLYVFDGYAGWEPETRVKVRIICSRPYHALFMNNMLIRPKASELVDFGEPDYVIYNAGIAQADTSIEGIDTTTSVSLDFGSGEFVILGTEYAGEMKKGVFTVMNYLMPKRGVLSMHCSANEGASGDVSLFFGLSGTGKTTLSADPQRRLIGDDEHGWSNAGVFNIEGGCYAKCINLSAREEPEIYSAIRFGSVVENVVVSAHTREVEYHDSSKTQNTRASYPIDFIHHAKIPCLGTHPENVVFLTCDAFGVLPPVSQLTIEQAMYHFISGYTAKIAGTEVGVSEPQATFSACFGAPFLVWHPSKYAELLADKLRKHDAKAWLVNTGWTGGPFVGQRGGGGERLSLRYTRAILHAIHNGDFDHVTWNQGAVFGLRKPSHCPHVPDEVLTPKLTWADPTAYDDATVRLAELFAENFEKFEDGASPEIAAAGPRLDTVPL